MRITVAPFAGSVNLKAFVFKKAKRPNWSLSLFIGGGYINIIFLFLFKAYLKVKKLPLSVFLK